MFSLRKALLSLLPLMSLASGKPIDYSSSSSSSKGGFSKVSGRQFVIDGKPEYLAGTNAYWLMDTMDDAVVDKSLGDMAAAGFTVVRVWGFNDLAEEKSQVHFQVLSGGKAKINEGTNGLQRLDAVVKAAEKHNLKLVIPFVNNWDAYGGIPLYAKAFGCSTTTWYTDKKCQDPYRAYVKAVVSRYKDSTAIFSWQLANEPRCKGCPTSVITEWATEVSKYVKTLDTNHLVSLGDEGFFANGGSSWMYQGSEGVDFKKNLEIPSLDYGTVHLYPESWEQPLSWGGEWIEEHDKAGAAAGKPVVIEEYGALTDQISTMGSWQSIVISSGIAMDMFWQFGNPTSPGAMDGYAVRDGALLNLCIGHAAKVKAKNGGASTPSSSKETSSSAPKTTSDRPSSYGSKLTTTHSSKAPESTSDKPKSTDRPSSYGSKPATSHSSNASESKSDKPKSTDKPTGYGSQPISSHASSTSKATSTKSDTPKSSDKPTGYESKPTSSHSSSSIKESSSKSDIPKSSDRPTGYESKSTSSHSSSSFKKSSSKSAAPESTERPTGYGSHPTATHTSESASPQNTDKASSKQHSSTPSTKDDTPKSTGKSAAPSQSSLPTYGYGLPSASPSASGSSSPQESGKAQESAPAATPTTNPLTSAATSDDGAAVATVTVIVTASPSDYTNAPLPDSTDDAVASSQEAPSSGDQEDEAGDDDDEEEEDDGTCEL